jgi:hypothetical protein
MKKMNKYLLNSFFVVFISPPEPEAPLSFSD